MAQDMGEEDIARRFLRNRSVTRPILMQKLGLCEEKDLMEAGMNPFIPGIQPIGIHPMWRVMHGSGPGMCLMMWMGLIELMGGQEGFRCETGFPVYHLL